MLKILKLTLVTLFATLSTEAQPLSIRWSTDLGGGLEQTSGHAIDSQGNIFLAGRKHIEHYVARHGQRFSRATQRLV